MRPELTALVVHDLKNALGALEAELLTLAQEPAAEPGAARQAHAHCADLRQRFMMFLTVYGVGGGLRARASDESPLDLLRSLACAAPDGPAVVLAPDDHAPPFWYFDRHLVRLALQAALHNAQRFARQRVELGARRDGRFLVLTIDDDGPGLGAADPSQHSTGLGTELCGAVARAHTEGGREGRVTLAGRPEGGARFELWLP